MGINLNPELETPAKDKKKLKSKSKSKPEFKGIDASLIFQKTHTTDNDEFMGKHWVHHSLRFAR